MMEVILQCRALAVHLWNIYYAAHTHWHENRVSTCMIVLKIKTHITCYAGRRCGYFFEYLFSSRVSDFQFTTKSVDYIQDVQCHSLPHVNIEYGLCDVHAKKVEKQFFACQPYMFLVWLSAADIIWFCQANILTKSIQLAVGLSTTTHVLLGEDSDSSVNWYKLPKFLCEICFCAESQWASNCIETKTYVCMIQWCGQFVVSQGSKTDCKDTKM
jgi:hypothetical protein